MSLKVNAKIVIVGCGISGIAAAHRLVKAGFHHVRIVEATARSGGRIKTGRLGERLYVQCNIFSFTSLGELQLFLRRSQFSSPLQKVRRYLAAVFALISGP